MAFDHSAAFTSCPYSVTVGSAALGSLPPKIITSALAASPESLATLITEISGSLADIIEIRADFLNETDTDTLTALLSQIRTLTAKPLLFTLRTQKEGGQCEIDDETYRQLISAIAACDCVDAIDIEFNRGIDKAYIDSVRLHSKAKLIVSYHNFEKTPEISSLMHTLMQMDALGGDVLKMAVMPASHDDVLRLMAVTATMRKRTRRPLITMSMGKMGTVTRIAGSVFGSCATFASFTQASAPGQLTIEQTKAFIQTLN